MKESSQNFSQDTPSSFSYSNNTRSLNRCSSEIPTNRFTVLNDFSAKDPS